MSDTDLTYRVIGWDESHETPQSLKKQGQRADVLLPTNLGTAAIQALMRSPEGPAVVGVWCVVQMLAANASRRGVLYEQGSPLTAAQLAQVTGWEVSLIERALTVLCQPGTRYLERVPLDIALQPPILPEPKPRAPRKPKPLPFTHCPNCNADLKAWANGTCRHPLHRIPASSDTTPVADAASVREQLYESEFNNPRQTEPQATCLTLGTNQQNVCMMGGRGSGDDVAHVDGFNRHALVSDYDDQGRRAELGRLTELIRRLETGQVDSPVVENYLESHAERLARQGEGEGQDPVTTEPGNKSPPEEVPRPQNRPNPNRSQRQSRRQKRRKKR